MQKSLRFLGPLVALVFALLPAPKKRSALSEPPTMWWRLRYTYRNIHNKLESFLARYHRVELYRVSYQFRLEEEEQKLIQARNKAREAGIGPRDERYPELDYESLV